VIIADTGPLLAAWNPREPRHAEIARWLARATEPVAVPSPVVVEVSYFLGRRLGAQHEARFLGEIGQGGILVEDPTAADYTRAAELVSAYAALPLGAVDAIVAAIAERLEVRTILTLDRRHFAALRLRHCDQLDLAP
jgi:predicted nucleic acid-binding protein